MKQVDHEFVPPLSLRPGGIYKRVSGTLANEDSNFLICESNGRVVGVVGYRKNWNGIEKVLLEAYISFIAVHPGHRGQNISGLLDLALAQNLDSDGTTHITSKHGPQTLLHTGCTSALAMLNQIPWKTTGVRAWIRSISGKVSSEP
jgi:GNAT superfamily N-acetyltransferase